MKRVILSISFLSLWAVSNAQTQIGNSNFEAWESSTSEIAEPINWNSFKTASGGMAWAASQQMGSSTLKRPGSTGTKSVKIWSKSIIGVKANGNVTLGQINMGSSTATDPSNYNYTNRSDAGFSEAFTDAPDSIVFWTRFVPGNAANQARMSCAIHKDVDFKDPNDVGNANTVATAAKNFVKTSSGSGWERHSVPFTYTANTPQMYIITTFTTNKTPGQGSSNDTLYVDDVELVYVPKASFTASGTSLCLGNAVNFTNTSTNYPTSYAWTFGDGNTSTSASPSHTYAATGTYNVTLTVTNQWGSTTSTTTTVTVNPTHDATFNYSNGTYCSNEGMQTPTVVEIGAFTASPAGLSINSTTGVVDLSTSTQGTYTVTNTIALTCPDVKTATITVNAAADAGFNYPSNAICSSDGNQTPTVTQAGTFTSTPAGLTFVSSTTGEIDMGNTADGTYTIKHIVGGACPDTVTVSVTVSSTPDATFSYANASYCANATDPSPVFGSGANGGVFSSTAGLTINSSTGVVDLSASTPGTYTVTNSIAAVGSCPADSKTTTIEVDALPVVALGAFNDVCVYNAAFALTGGSPAGGTYSGTGVSAGNFDPSLVSAGSTITITYSYTDPTSTCSNTATNTIFVDACLGLDETANTALALYPNPTSSVVKVINITEEVTFTVYAVNGKVVSTGSLSPNATEIDLSMVENGMYMVQIDQQLFRVVKK
jgi:PKD repeat protein